MTGARAQPIVLTLEDLHWADPTTLDVFRGIAERGAMAPLFVLLTARPEFRPPWGVRSHHSTISLAPLDRSQVRQMVGELAARHALSREVVDGVTERTGGVPLFIEEVTRLLLERGEHGGIHAIPPTLQQSLTSRLDRLGPAREVVQIGAVIGRDFSYPLLRAVAGTEDVPLQMALERLAEADILLVQSTPPESDYRFKHVLIQEAAYENLLKSRRQGLHRRVGEALRDDFSATAAAEPELLAHHFTRADMTEAAIEWWGKAAQRSLERSALVEAVEQLTRALDQIANLPATPGQRREQIKFQVALITPLSHVKGYAAPETRAATERARLLIDQSQALGDPPEDPLTLFSALFGFLVLNLVAFNGNVLRQLAAEFLEFAEKQGTTPLLLEAHRWVGICLLYWGDFVESLPHFERTIELYDPAEHRSLAARFGQDAEAHVLCYHSWGLWLLGYPKAALVDARRAVCGARGIGQAGTLMTVLALTVFPYVFCGDDAAALAQLDELAGLADEKGSLYWKAFAMWLQGWLLALAGKAPEAVHMLTSGIAAFRSTGAALFAPTQFSCLATAYAKAGQFDEARRSISDAMKAIETSKETWFEAEANRVAGEIALKSSEPDSANAEMYFERALAVARRQQAKSWELRAAMSMARLWRDQGRRNEARELLAPVYGWLTEGFDTRDLKEAKALLDKLRDQST